MSKEIDLRQLDVQIALFMGVEPSITWEILNKDETATACTFESENGAREWLEYRLNGHPDSWLKDSHVGTWKHYPHYSSDISAAMLVIKKIREWDSQDQYYFTLYLKWAIEDRIKEGVLEGKVIIYAEPVDICKAALRTLKDPRCVAALKVVGEGEERCV